MEASTRDPIDLCRRLTVVFQGGGQPSRLFFTILEIRFDILTHCKGGFRKISENRFLLQKSKFQGRRPEHLLHDEAARFLNGRLRPRQAKRPSEASHQTALLTSCWRLRNIVVASHMYDRRHQDNFFKYMRQEFGIGALVDYKAVPDDPNRSIPNSM